jgi:hypothetical protein
LNNVNQTHFKYDTFVNWNHKPCPMLQILYTYVFGPREHPASSEQINDMMLAATPLPYRLLMS